MPVYKGNQMQKKLFKGNQKIKMAYVGGTRVYTSSNIVYYHVDTGDTRQVEVEYGASTLNPPFTPSKSGWTFFGWASTGTSWTTLTSQTMGENPIHLYAVFRQDITLTYQPNGASGSASSENKRRSYNNAAIDNPVFTLKSNPYSWAEHTFQGWSTDSSALTGVAAGTTVTLTQNTTYYAIWEAQVLTVFSREYTGGWNDIFAPTVLNTNYVTIPSTFYDTINGVHLPAVLSAFADFNNGRGSTTVKTSYLDLNLRNYTRAHLVFALNTDNTSDDRKVKATLSGIISGVWDPDSWGAPTGGLIGKDTTTGGRVNLEVIADCDGNDGKYTSVTGRLYLTGITLYK